ncbi:leucine-rich repeat-containing protein 37A3-like [Marmota monax]|uniref:leucine-rich repeat-containing protein 37A3-like n=1 Tax=Marmota monax TaxID=9995 RepID=UPI0026EC6E93|nr:leucine-rich repeat-containing protein 37A3-like [Marmota monax]
MSLLRLWAPGLLLTWQPLWLLVQAAQPLESPQDPLQLTTEHPGPIKPWSLLSSELPPLSPHALTPPADPGVFDDLGSSARSQMLDSPRKLTDSLLPFLGRVSPGELAPEMDQFAVQDQFAASRQTNSEREAPRIGSNSAKAAKFIVSPLNLKKDVAQHPRFAKVVGGTPKQFAKLQLQNNLQDDYVYPSTDVASSGNLPPESQENSEESPETPDQVEPSVEAQETPEELQSSSSQQEVPEDQEALGGEASMHHKLSSLRSDTQPVVTSKPADLVTVTPQADKEIHLPSGQEQAPTQPSEGLEVVEPSSTQKEAPAQTSELSEPSLAEQETPVQAPKSPMENIAETLPTLPVVPSLGQDQVHYYNLPSVTGRPADVEITITSEPTKEAESSLAQQEAPVRQRPSSARGPSSGGSSSGGPSSARGSSSGGPSSARGSSSGGSSSGGPSSGGPSSASRVCGGGRTFSDPARDPSSASGPSCGD